MLKNPWNVKIKNREMKKGQNREKKEPAKNTRYTVYKKNSRIFSNGSRALITGPILMLYGSN